MIDMDTIHSDLVKIEESILGETRGKSIGTHHFCILVAAWRKQSSQQKRSSRGLLEQTPHAKRLYPFLPSNIVTDCADL